MSGKNEDFENEMLLVYLASKLTNISPYDYLFTLPNDYLEVDGMIALLGLNKENEEIDKIDSS